MLPRPERPGGPPILIGGNGPKRTLPLAARYADEWNAVYLSRDDFRERNRLLNELLAENGREPEEVRRSLMTRCEIGDEKTLADTFAPSSLSLEEIRERGLVVGTPKEIVDQLGAWAEAGVQRIMLQWLDLDNLDGLETLGMKVLSQVQA